MISLVVHLSRQYLNKVRRAHNVHKLMVYFPSAFALKAFSLVKTSAPLMELMLRNDNLYHELFRSNFQYVVYFRRYFI